MADQYIAVFRE